MSGEVDEYGFYIVVCDILGMHRMKPADFCQYDEDIQVSRGEEGKRYEIFCVYLFSQEIVSDDKLWYAFNWRDAQAYFKQEQHDETTTEVEL